MNTYKRWYNFSKVKEKNTPKCENSECRKYEKYINMREILSNIY